MNTQEIKDCRFNPDYSLAVIAVHPAGSILKTSFTLTGYLEGFATTTGYAEKYGLIKHYAINSSLLSLYATAFPGLTNLPDNRIIWSAKDRYLFAQGNSTVNACKPLHAYCFEFTAPAVLSDQIPAMIKNTLDNYFGIITGFEERDMPCMVLLAGKRFRRIPKATKALVNTLDEKDAEKRLYGSSQLLCNYLDRHLAFPVVNGIPGELVDITFPVAQLSLDSLKAWLFLYGFELISSVQKIKVFTINDAY